MHNISGKHILLIMPKYFGYEKYIIEEFNTAGAIVEVIFENVFDINITYKVIKTLSKTYMNYLLNKYYISRISKIELKSLDFVLIIRGSTISETIIALLKNSTKDACKYILYQWDSLMNNPSINNIIKYFDKILTFDLYDASENGWVYRPLFYIPSLCCGTDKKSIDILYICSLHSERLKILEHLKKFCLKNNLNLKYLIYVHPLIYLKNRFYNKNSGYVGTSIKSISFQPIKLAETYRFYGNSKCVVDFTHPNQNGLTMRTIESTCHKCKLITNNKSIIKSDFYDKNNICIYDSKPEISLEFIKKPYKEINNVIYERYSLNRWIDDLLF